MKSWKSGLSGRVHPTVRRPSAKRFVQAKAQEIEPNTGGLTRALFAVAISLLIVLFVALAASSVR